MERRKPKRKPKTTESEKITYPAIIFDSKSKKLKEGKLSYDAPDDKSVNGYGRYISIDVANILVDTLRATLKRHKLDNSPYGVTFGIEQILSILSQKDCEGIRFYFAERRKDLWDKNSPYAKYEGLTLVAVGVDANNKDLGTDGGYIIHNAPGNRKGRAKSAAATATKSSSTKVVEIVPPEP